MKEKFRNENNLFVVIEILALFCYVYCDLNSLRKNCCAVSFVIL